MRGVDTNVLVRLLVSDDLSHQRRAAARVERANDRGEGLLVTPLVLASLCWVLEAGYDFRREQIADAVRALLESPPFVVTQRAQVEEALGWYEQGPAGFADYLILSAVRAEGGEGLITFDRALLKRPDCERP